MIFTYRDHKKEDKSGINECGYQLLILERPILHVGEGNGNPLQYSCLENSMGGGAWWATVHGVTKELDTTE